MRPLGNQGTRSPICHPVERTHWPLYAAPASWEPVLACTGDSLLGRSGSWERQGHIVLPGLPPPALPDATPLPANRELLLLSDECTDFPPPAKNAPGPLAEPCRSSAEAHRNTSVLGGRRLLVLGGPNFEQKRQPFFFPKAFKHWYNLDFFLYTYLASVRPWVQSPVLPH